MDIQGLQKLTLLDYPGLTACTVFLGGCNFRCPYCHNGELATGAAPAVLDDSGLFRFLETRRGLLDGVCITGGEPLLRPEMESLMSGIKGLGFSVKLDTNGTQPGRLRRLVEQGLVDYVAMDIKNSPSRYAATAGVKDVDLDAVRESVSFLLSGSVEYEFRTTVVKGLHDAQAFSGIGSWVKGAKRYFLQQFEDRETILCRGLSPCPGTEMEAFAKILKPCVSGVYLRGI